MAGEDWEDSGEGDVICWLNYVRLLEQFNMNYFFFALLAISLSANSAEFMLNGSIIKSTVTVKEAKCDGYSILVKEDRFPEEARGHVPEGFGIEGYLGWDAELIVSAKAFLKSNSIEHAIPSVIEKYQKTGKLLTDEGRAYIPYEGFCLSKNVFLLVVDSGGNCSGCDALIKYRINKDGSIHDIGFPSWKERKKALGY